MSCVWAVERSVLSTPFQFASAFERHLRRYVRLRYGCHFDVRCVRMYGKKRDESFAESPPTKNLNSYRHSHLTVPFVTCDSDMCINIFVSRRLAVCINFTHTG